jgi:hypothetical protein
VNPNRIDIPKRKVKAVLASSKQFYKKDFDSKESKYSS